MTLMNPPLATLLFVKVKTLRIIEVADAIVMATHIMHGWSIPIECAVVELTTIREGRQFKDLDYPNKGEGIEKLKDAKGNFILCPHKDIILKISSSLIVSPQNREDEGIPTFQNTLHSIAKFTPPSQNPPQTTHPPENRPPTQPFKHHTPPRIVVPKSPPHTTPPLQNPPSTQPLEHHSLLRHSTPHTTTRSPQNPLTEQALQHHSPQHVHSPKSPPHNNVWLLRLYG
jgi:hypothetical protein